MRILVDADACPVRKQIEKIAMIYGVRVLFYANTSCQIRPTFGRVIKVDTYPEAVDEALLRRCDRDDIVVTQDFRLAAKCLAKGAYVLHHDGWIYTEELLLKKHRGNTPKRRKANNKAFEWTFEDVLITALMKKIS